jgi:hypothetical protein
MTDLCTVARTIEVTQSLRGRVYSADSARFVWLVAAMQ